MLTDATAPLLRAAAGICALGTLVAGLAMPAQAAEPEPIAPVATIAVGEKPRVAVLTPDGSTLVVPNLGGSSVSLIDTATNRVRATVPLSGQVASVAVNPAGTEAYASQVQAKAIAVIDLATAQVTSQIPVANEPQFLALNAQGNRLYASTANASSIVVVNPVMRQVVATIPLKAQPFRITLSPNGRRLYVSMTSADRITVLDTASNTVIARVRVGDQPARVVVSGGRVYVPNFGAGTISVIDGNSNKVVRTYQAGDKPNPPVIDAKRGLLYTALGGEDRLIAIDLASGETVRSVKTGASPWGTFANADMTRIFTPNLSASSVSAVCVAGDWSVSTLQAQQGPLWLVGGPYLYSVNTEAGSVSAFEAGLRGSGC